MTQHRVGCGQCAAEGCGGGPAVGYCRRWMFGILLHAPLVADDGSGAHEAAMEAANVTRMPTCGTNATRTICGTNATAVLSFDHPFRAGATGVLRYGAMRYYSVRAPHAGMRIHVSLYLKRGAALVFVRRGRPPGGDAADYDFTAEYEMATQLALTIPQPNMSCVAAGADGSLAALAAAGGVVVGGAAPLCDEWVIGVLGDTWTDVDPNHAVPQVAESAYELVVRTEPDHPDFACAECGFDCTRCGWVAGHGTQFVVDSLGQRVARLTNTTAQMGTLWLDQPRKIDRGFEARFTFRVSDFTYCNEPFERFGHVNRAVTTTEELLLGQGANYEGGSEHFMPAEGLRNNGESPTHYRMDDPDLPWEPLYPPTGIPLDLAQSLGRMSNPPARSGEQLPLPFSGGPGGAAPRVEYYPRCEGGRDMVGGEGFAFVIQSEGPDAAGCAGAGVGYASVPDGPLACNRSISRSVAIQFDTHARLRIDAYRQDADPDDTRTRLKWDRWNAMGIFTDGRNRQEDEHTVYMIDPSYENFQIDDGEVHHVAITYTHRRRQEHRPPDKYGVGGIRGTGLGVLEVTLDHGIARSEGTVLQNGVPYPKNWEPTLTFHVDLTEYGIDVERAWVGFTASTSDIAAEHHDIRSFSFCERLGCAPH